MANEMLVGFIGLGTMGGKMAANLQKAGYKLVVHDLHRQAASHHLNAGAVWADTPRKVAEQCDVLFTSLPEPTDVEGIAAGDNGLLAGTRKDAAWFDLSDRLGDAAAPLRVRLTRRASHGRTVTWPPAGSCPAVRRLWQSDELHPADPASATR